jgi:hypothetical protein
MIILFFAQGVEAYASFFENSWPKSLDVESIANSNHKFKRRGSEVRKKPPSPNFYREGEVGT